MTTATTDDEPSSAAVFKECCTWQSPAVLVLSDDSIRLEGRFHAVDEEEGVVQLCVTSFGRLRRMDDIRLGQYCGVSFVHRDRPCFFLGMMNDNFYDFDKPIVEFRLPTVIRAEMRRTYRVPVLKDCLKVTVLAEGRDEPQHPRVLNISLTGALLEYDLRDDPDLQFYEKVALSFSYRDEIEIALRGIVRRRDTSPNGRRYGLLFPETAGAAEPPPALVEITQRVERLWLGEEDLD